MRFPSQLFFTDIVRNLKFLNKSKVRIWPAASLLLAVQGINAFTAKVAATAAKLFKKSHWFTSFPQYARLPSAPPLTTASFPLPLCALKNPRPVSLPLVF
jgi:hypothetical protein